MIILNRKVLVIVMKVIAAVCVFIFFNKGDVVMEKSKKILIAVLIILILVPAIVFFITDATRGAGKYVKLEATQTVSTSGSVYGRWKYITTDTVNDESSVQSMYAVMQYRHRDVYINETGVYIAPGESAPYTASFCFAEPLFWRLELTPQDADFGGVSGEGTIYDDSKIFE